ncbi:RNA polymerase sigma-70 factor [Spirosoma terrae]
MALGARNSYYYSANTYRSMITNQAATTYRPTLLAIAYRMTGELMASEDIVQDVLLRFMNNTPENIQDRKAYLAKSVMNASLTYLDRVKREREVYKGIWLPEPVMAESHRAMDARLDISYGFMLLLEKLSPMERAIFVLKESFEFSYPELAKLFETTEANGRQLYHRAKEKMAGTNRRYVSDSQRKQELLRAFVDASETGDVESLIQQLKTDVALYTDGGGKVAAAIKPLFGLATVEQFLRGLASKFGHLFISKWSVVNGEPALLLIQKEDNRLDTIMILESDETGIERIFAIRNPDKLKHL